MSPVDDITTELAKGAASGLAAEGVRQAAQLFGKLVGGQSQESEAALRGTLTSKTDSSPLAQLRGFLAEQFLSRRIELGVETLVRCNQKLRAAGIAPKPVSPNVMMPILDAASEEGSEDLRELWAGLLAAAAAGSKYPITRFIKMLEALDPVEANLLEVLFRRGAVYEQSKNSLSKSILHKEEHVDAITIDLVSEHLQRDLGLVHSLHGDGGTSYCLTLVGTQLLRACHLEGVGDQSG